METIRQHGSCVRWLDRGLLITGASGAGKTRLVCELVLAGADLVADDLVQIRRSGDQLLASAAARPQRLAIRGQGIVRLAAIPSVRLTHIVELGKDDNDPLPARQRRNVLDIDLPLLILGQEAVGVGRLAVVLSASPWENY